MLHDVVDVVALRRHNATGRVIVCLSEPFCWITTIDVVILINFLDIDRNLDLIDG